MATIVLQAVGAAVGGVIGGPIGAVLGRAAGAIGGRYIDQQIFGETRTFHGPRLDSTRVLSSREGAPVARVYGRGRVSGEIIWATAFEEDSTTTSSSAGGKAGGGSKVETTTYSYYANFAIGLCEGEIGRIGRIWADGDEIVQPDHMIRTYTGTESQMPDPLIEAKQGQGNAPAYRGLAYLVFERLPLARYGNRIPQISVEIIRPVSAVAKRVRAVNMIPGATEFGYDPQPVSQLLDETNVRHLNVNQTLRESDFEASLDDLCATCPNLEQVALVVAWFGTDLRAGFCRIEPRVDEPERQLAQGEDWAVAGLARHRATPVSRHNGRAAYGGTPSDASVIRAIQAIRSRGLRVALNPFVMMDVPENNNLASPYGGDAQPAYPWRGRITCHPAPDQPDTVSGTAAAAAQVNRLANGRGDGKTYERMILHYARLAAQAGGVDLFIIGSELRGLTSVRGTGDTFPFVDFLTSLAADVRALVGPDTRLTYGADWSEYFGYQPANGSGDVFYNLDPLWADANIDAVGIDNYVPISDWRDRGAPDGVGSFSTEPDMLAANVARGEGYDYYYATRQDREEGLRTPITDGAGKPWVYRYKDFANWWSNAHFDRRGGVEQEVASPWVPGSKPIIFTEYGFPAVHNSAAQPNVFVDRKSGETALPYFSKGTRDDLAMINSIDAVQRHWDERHPQFVAANNPQAEAYDGRMVDVGSSQLWAWDARPFPAFPTQPDLWADAENWFIGHWLNGRLDALPVKDLIAALLESAGFTAYDVQGVQGMVDGYILGEPASPRSALESILAFYRIAVHEDRGTLVFRSPSWGPTQAHGKHALAFEADTVEAAIERLQGTDLPTRVRVLHLNPQTAYDDAETSARLVQEGGAGDVALSLPVVAESAILEPVAAAYIEGLRLGQESITFTLPPSHLSASVGDVVQLPHFSQDRFWRVDSIEDGTARKITASAHIEGEPPTWEARVTAQRAVAAAMPSALTTVAKPKVALLDLPYLRPSQTGANRVAAAAQPWPGDVAVHVSPTDADHSFTQVVPESAVMGTLVAPLAGSQVTSRLSHAASFDFRVTGGVLQSVDMLALLAGANAFAVQSTTGRYEVLQARMVTLVGDKTYRLTGLLRGQAGTEPEAAAGAAVGATIVLLDARVPALAGASERLGAEHEWLVGPARDPLDAFTYRRIRFAPGLRGLQPYRPAHLRVSYAPSQPLVLSWIRRDRLSDEDWDARDIPMSEDSELYEITVFAGQKQLTLTSSEQSITISAHDLAQAFGAAAVARLEVAQVSRRAGAGPPAKLSLL